MALAAHSHPHFITIAAFICAHGVVQGYNGVAATDSKHQVIVCAEAFGEGNEIGLLEPMLEGIRENLNALGEEGDPLRDKVLVTASPT